MAIIIGISGFAGSGKDTLATAALGELHERGHQAVIRPFAHHLKAVTKSLGINPNDRTGKERVQTYSFEHFELALADAIEDNLGAIVGADDLAELFAFFTTALRSSGYVSVDQKLTISPRKFQQLLGTEGGRAVRESFWLDVFKASLLHYSPTMVVLAPDVRFKNEAAVCDYRAGIYRPGIEPVSAHASEADIPELTGSASFIVHNTGSLRGLEASGRSLAQSIAYRFLIGE